MAVRLLTFVVGALAPAVVSGSLPECPPNHFWRTVEASCGGCTSLVESESYFNRCDKYCESIGSTCVGAAEEVDETCSPLEAFACNATIPDTSDILCACEGPSSPTCLADDASRRRSAPTCAELDACDEAAGSRRRSAGAEARDFCQSSCSAQLGCQASSDPPVEAVAEEYECPSKGSWPYLDLEGADCGPCTALVQTGPHYTCDDFCQSFGLECAAAAEDLEDSSCAILFSMGCSERFDHTSDMMCTCQVFTTTQTSTTATTVQLVFVSGSMRLNSTGWPNEVESVVHDALAAWAAWSNGSYALTEISVSISQETAIAIGGRRLSNATNATDFTDFAVWPLTYVIQTDMRTADALQQNNATEELLDLLLVHFDTAGLRLDLDSSEIGEESVTVQTATATETTASTSTTASTTASTTSQPEAGGEGADVALILGVLGAILALAVVGAVVAVFLRRGLHAAQQVDHSVSEPVEEI